MSKQNPVLQTNSELCAYKKKLVDTKYDSFVELALRQITSCAINYPHTTSTKVDYLVKEEVLYAKTGEYRLGIFPIKRWVPKHFRLLTAFSELTDLGYKVHIEYNRDEERWEVIVTHKCNGLDWTENSVVRGK